VLDRAFLPRKCRQGRGLWAGGGAGTGCAVNAARCALPAPRYRIGTGTSGMCRCASACLGWQRGVGSVADCPGLAAVPLAVGLPISGMTRPGLPQDECDRSDLVGLKSIDEVGGAAAIRQRGIPFRVTYPLATDHYQPASLTQPAARALKIGPAASRVCRRQTWAATQRWSGRGKPWGDNGHSDS
jgi:hypothetical protein